MLDYLETVVYVNRMLSLVDVSYEAVLNGKVEDSQYPRAILTHLA